jgi:hypothetical protein
MNKYSDIARNHLVIQHLEDQIAHHDEEIHESRVGGSICERGHRDRLGGLGTQGGSMFGLVGWFG